MRNSFLVILMILSFNSFSAPQDHNGLEGAKLYFSKQTYSLFFESDLKLDVSNGRVKNNGVEKEVVADLKITPLKAKQELISSVQKKMISGYMRPEMPSALAEKASASEKAAYTDMTTHSVAEYIVKASLGDSVDVGVPIYRQSSRMQVFKENESNKEYLIILGKKVYVEF